MAASLAGEGKAVDVRELFNLLEENDIRVVDEVCKLIQENLSSTKESWLLHSLVDYYFMSNSTRARDILTEAREPHDKHLVEKLCDGLRIPDQRLSALQLLLHVVCKQPLWINRVVTMPIFGMLLKCLKNEMDIPVLMTAVMVITILLPSVPVHIGSHLPEIFEIFSRLAAFNIKRPGNNPEVFFLHLQVSVYALFHRLYGMFPCNFLTYLRQYYSKKDHAVVYEEVVKPMLERVRLHPNLISGSKEAEVTANRWRQMESQDVMVECAKMSLDLIEGTWEELHCPVIAPRYSLVKSMFPDEKSSKTGPPVVKVSKLSLAPQFSSPGSYSEPSPGAQDGNVFWSPSMTLGLSTPPPSQRTTPATSLLDTSTSIPHSFQGTFSNTPVISTPACTPAATPPVGGDDSERTQSRNSNRGSLFGRIPDKRLSTTNTPSRLLSSGGASAQSAVPPSPLKAEFTSEPPVGTMRSQPVGRAARELQFDAITESTSDVPTHIDYIPNQEGKEDLLPPHYRDQLSTTGSQGMSESVTVDSLPMLIEGLDTTESELDDQEVSEITKSGDEDGSIQSGQQPTAESVAKFMRSINRIRFNSLTITNNVEQVLMKDKFSSKTRSRSCPLLPELLSEEETEHEVLSRSVSSTWKQFEPVYEDSCDASVVEDSDISRPGDHVTSFWPINNQLNTSLPTGQAFCLCPVHSPGSRNISSHENDQSQLDYVSLLRCLLSPATLTICKKCQTQLISDTHPARSGLDVPLFSTFSPPELLDRHLKLGTEIHAKELSKIPMTSHDSINWTHFGGVPPADEVNILRGQIMLIHNQLMYERHKRELHAYRNRRLLRKIANAKAVEEQNKAFEAQIEIQDTEIRNLQVSLKLLQDENKQLRDSKESNEYEKLVGLRSCLQENEDLMAAKKELNSLLVRQREEHEVLNKKLQTAEWKLFQAEKELEHMTEQVVLTQKLKEQVLQLRKELLLMGELQRKYEEKVQATKLSHNTKQEQEHLVRALKAENKVLKSQLDNKSVLFEGSQNRLLELEDTLKNKDIALSEVKRNFENVKTSHDAEIKVVEDKYQSIVRVNQQLEGQLLHLHSQIDQLKAHTNYKGIDRKAPSGVDKTSAELEPRERTASDPVTSYKSKDSLMRLGSVPVSCSMVAGDDTCDTIGTNEAVYLRAEGAVAMETPSNISIETRRTSELETEDSSIAAPQAAATQQNDSVSLCSRESRSSLFNYASRSSTLLYTDSEDTPSVSSRSNTLSDSGYVG